MPASAMDDRAGSVPRIFREAELRHLLAREVQRCTRYQDFLSVCLVRADYSGAPRSETQTAVAQQIAEMLRSTDIVGDVGHDIAVLLVHTPDTDAAVIVDRIRDRIQAGKFPGATGSGPVTVSVGLVSFPTDATSDTALLSQAQAQLITTPQV